MDLFDIPADLDTPVSAFLKVAEFDPCFLLESVEGGETLGRYSFIGLGEGLRFQVTAATVRTNDDLVATPVSGSDLLQLFRRALDLAPELAPTATELSFAGGLVGASSFELAGRFFDRDLPTGTGQLLADYVAPRSLLVFDHVTHRIALLHDGPEMERLTLRSEIVRALRGAVRDSQGSGDFQEAKPEIEPRRFFELVERAREHIVAGDVYQLVLSIAFEGRHNLDPFQVYRALRILNPSPYMYFYRSGEISIVGSSPEALVRLDGRQASLRPIAGTRPRGSDHEADIALESELLDDPKEAAEHVMLVDLARNDVGRVSVPGSVKVSPFRAVERYSHVMHLVSGVEGVLRQPADAFSLFRSAFPAGTVVGAPKVRAAELITDLEPTPRGFYAGTMGYFGHGGRMDQAITIRTIVFERDTYRYQAGAGIVFDSNPALEHAEVMAKSAILREALVLAAGGLHE